MHNIISICKEERLIAFQLEHQCTSNALIGTHLNPESDQALLQKIMHD